MYNYIFFLADSLEKVFPLVHPRIMPNGQDMPVFAGEIPAVQLVYTRQKEHTRVPPKPISISVKGSPAEAVLRSVELIPADFPAYETADDNYIITEPGLFPDLLKPLIKNEIIPVPGQYRSVWIDFPGIGGEAKGKYKIVISLSEDNKVIKELNFNFNVLGLPLPAQDIIHTHWFYADCLSSFYNTEPLGEEHWKIIEEFIKPMSSAYSVNMLLTPVFTPPLDTLVGGERPTIQLVGIKITNGV